MDMTLPYYRTPVNCNVETWLNLTPMIAGDVPEDQHLPFLIRLFIALEKAGIPLEQHLECAIEGLIEELN